MHGRKRWAWIVLGLMFGCPCLLTGLVLTTIKIGFTNAGNRIPEEVAAARAAGLATEPEDLTALTAIPDKDNAAGAYEAAFAAYKAEWPKDDHYKALVHYSQGEDTPAEDKEVDGVLRSTTRSAALFMKASEKPGVDWRRPWQQGTDVMFPELASMKGGAKLLAWRAIDAAKRGDTSGAIRDLTAGLRMAAHAGKDPTVIAMLVQIALDKICLQATWRVVNIRHDAATLDRVKRMLDGIEPFQSYQRAIGGEIVMERIGCRNLARYVQDEKNSDWISPYNQFPFSMLVRDPAFRRAVEAKVVHNHVLAYQATLGGKTWKEIKPGWDRMTNQVQADHSLEGFIANYMVLEQLIDPPATDAAYRNILKTAVAILSIHAKTGHFPASLPGMGSDSVDPFTDRPLGYKITADGFKIYSIDRDGVDDGGLSQHEDTKGKSKTHDISFAFKLR